MEEKEDKAIVVQDDLDDEKRRCTILAEGLVYTKVFNMNSEYEIVYSEEMEPDYTVNDILNKKDDLCKHIYNKINEEDMLDDVKSQRKYLEE